MERVAVGLYFLIIFNAVKDKWSKADKDENIQIVFACLGNGVVCD